MAKWMKQLIISNKCRWIWNSGITVKKGAITLANPIKSIIRLFSHIFFSHVNSLVFPPPTLFFSAVTDEHAMWDSNNCTEHVYLNNCPIAQSNKSAECVCLNVFHVHGITYSNKCSCVYYNVWGSRYTHTCLCVYPGPYSPWMALTHLGAKALTIFQFKFM